MAIDVTPINSVAQSSSIRPAFLRLAPSILDAARPQIEPVGYNQRFGFVGPANPLARAYETSPTYLRAFTDRASPTQSSNDPFSIGSLGRDELTLSRTALQPAGRQLGLFGSESPDSSARNVGFQTNGLARYSAIQSNDSGLRPRSLSLAV